MKVFFPLLDGSYLGEVISLTFIAYLANHYVYNFTCISIFYITNSLDQIRFIIDNIIKKISTLNSLYSKQTLCIWIDFFLNHYRLWRWFCKPLWRERIIWCWNGWFSFVFALLAISIYFLFHEIYCISIQYPCYNYVERHLYLSARRMWGEAV